ncbi:hypothetical protein C5E23_18765 [Pectobacterium parmentieri]|nr:hypothetical protein C5E25_18830 [Pectobacterium parmentieri]AYH16076.1 hypothetical protein C5E23_18765 [Pectobacterium parmentieri]AYH24786.1 hypothetical protein C5E21_18845 [Pectobacterium parmentieri]
MSDLDYKSNTLIKDSYTLIFQEQRLLPVCIDHLFLPDEKKCEGFRWVQYLKGEEKAQITFLIPSCCT